MSAQVHEGNEPSLVNDPVVVDTSRINQDDDWFSMPVLNEESNADG
jgi:uncharacterized protein YccT (UPF0319 family)